MDEAVATRLGLGQLGKQLSMDQLVVHRITEETHRERLALEHHAAAFREDEEAIDQQLKQVTLEIGAVLHSGVTGAPLDRLSSDENVRQHQLGGLLGEVDHELQAGVDCNPRLQPPVHEPFPVHWGEPPPNQARDLRELPGGYGVGNSTLAAWIEQRMAEDLGTSRLSTDVTLRQQQLQELFGEFDLGLQVGIKQEIVEHDVGPPEEDFPRVTSWNSDRSDMFDHLPLSGFEDENVDFALLDLDVDGQQDFDAHDLPAMVASAEELTTLLKDAADLERTTSTESPSLAAARDLAGHRALSASVHAQSTAVVCPPCGPSADSLKQLRAIHKRKAVEELMKDSKQALLDITRPLQCSFAGCNYKASKPRYLREHERVHTGERPYKCPWAGCTYAAAGQGHISRHIRTHTGVKPYACKEPGCGYATSQSGHLRTHMRTHSGERPFKCNVPGCTYAAGRRGHLLRHMKIHSAGGGGDVSPL